MEWLGPQGEGRPPALPAVAREALVWKLEGLSEYDIRRPLVRTGTNLLGLVKHVASVDGAAGLRPGDQNLAEADEAWWAAYRDRLERAARDAPA